MSEIDKVKPSHHSRLALVYVRQSSAAQVEHNRESTLRQYALANALPRWVGHRRGSPSSTTISACPARAHTSAAASRAWPPTWHSATWV